MAHMTARIYLTSSWTRKIMLTAMLLGLAPATTFGAGPGVMIPHRALWPDPINSAAQFDRASRAEILVFAHELAGSETLNETAWKARLGVDSVDVASIEHLRHKLWKLLTDNYTIAAAGCATHDAFCPDDVDPGQLRHEAAALSAADIQPRYRPWLDDAMQFHRTYLDELLRLAAVFPRLNNEVETLNDNEWPGWGCTTASSC
jgi:peptidoglycan-N-acetylglucosamine deacetylase